MSLSLRILSLGLFFSFALCLFLWPNFSKKRELLKNIQQIPPEDRWAIDSFFRIFLLKSSGAYVLFGDKPMAFDAYFDFSRKEIPTMSFSFPLKYWQENKQLREGWKAWEKYRHLFPSDRFILKAAPPDEDWIEIILIDRKNFKKIIEGNLGDFQTLFKGKNPADVLLERYENDDQQLFALLKENHALFGILLGFGKRNAQLFQKRNRILCDDHYFTLKVHPRPSPEFASLDEERLYYEKNLKGAFAERNSRACYKLLWLPGFIVDPRSAETRELKKKYLEQRRHIHQVYSRGHFLETTLKRFCLE